MKATGKLLDQIEDLKSSMGLAYERAIAYEKSDHSHDRHMLVCPRGACRMRVDFEKEKMSFKVDSTKILWVPANFTHSDEGLSAIYDTLALFPNEEYFLQIFSGKWFECGGPPFS